MLLKIVEPHRSNYYFETEGLLPQEQRGFRPAQSTIDTLLVVRRLQELERLRKNPLLMCFIGVQKAYVSADRELLWEVLTSSGAPTKMLTIIRNFHEGMRARVRTDDGEHLE